MKKTYEIPSVEMTQLAMGSIICASGDPVINNGGNTGSLGGGAPIGD